MSADIKPGDLVMVVRGISCCGELAGLSLGYTFVAGRTAVSKTLNCKYCGRIHLPQLAVDMPGRYSIFAHMVKKLDPPAEGDSLPTRTDLEMPA